MNPEPGIAFVEASLERDLIHRQRTDGKGNKRDFAYIGVTGERLVIYLEDGDSPVIYELKRIS
jgi:hypothetical protein